MIIFDHVTKDYYLDAQSAVTPVKEVSLNVTRGDFIVIVGRSGSGKTTLLNLAAGLIKPTNGEVRVDNVNLWDMTDDEMSSFRNQKMGFVFQFPSLIPTLNAVQNVVVPTIFVGAKEKRNGARERAIEMLETLGLGDRVGAYPRQLSAGEQKRVVIARALINCPAILLADEPTSDLDTQTEEEMMALFRGIQADGVTIVMVTHSLELIPYATRAFRMDNGILTDITGVSKSPGVKASKILNAR